MRRYTPTSFRALRPWTAVRVDVSARTRTERCDHVASPGSGSGFPFRAAAATAARRGCAVTVSTTRSRRLDPVVLERQRPGRGSGCSPAPATGRTPPTLRTPHRCSYRLAWKNETKAQGDCWAPPPTSALQNPNSASMPACRARSMASTAAPIAGVRRQACSVRVVDDMGRHAALAPARSPAPTRNAVAAWRRRTKWSGASCPDGSPRRTSMTAFSGSAVRRALICSNSWSSVSMISRVSFRAGRGALLRQRGVPPLRRVAGRLPRFLVARRRKQRRRRGCRRGERGGKGRGRLRPVALLRERIARKTDEAATAGSTA